MCRVAVGRLTMSQVDPAVFAELPPEVAAELAAALPPSHASFFTEGNIMPVPSSPSASGEDAVAAAQADQRAQTAATVPPSILCTPCSSQQSRIARLCKLSTIIANI